MLNREEIFTRPSRRLAGTHTCTVAPRSRVVGCGPNSEAAAAELLRVVTFLYPNILGQQEIGSEE